MRAISKKVNSWLDVPTSDPDDARRRKLLNIILAGFIVLGIPLLLSVIWLWFTQPRDVWMAGASILFWATTVFLVVSILLFILNHYVRGWLASGSAGWVRKLMMVSSTVWFEPGWLA